MKFALSIIFAAVVVGACNPSPDRRVNEDAVREELKQREVKRISEGEILAAAQKRGGEIAAAAQAALFSELQQALGEGGVTAAIRYCNVSALPIADSLSRVYDARIRRTSFKTRNPSNKPNGIETQALEAYRYTYSQDSVVSENVQPEEDEILFTKPIIVQNPLCLNCHGEVDEDIKPSDYDVLRQLYPDDQATGYNMGDFRGMWSIALSRKSIVLSL